MHPAAVPQLRTERKRLLLQTWSQCPPLAIHFDGGAPGLKGGVPSMRMDPNVQAELPDFEFVGDSIKCSVKFDEDEPAMELTIPLAAIHTITCVNIRETHLWALDAELAQARVQMTYQRGSAGLH